MKHLCISLCALLFSCDWATSSPADAYQSETSSEKKCLPNEACNALLLDDSTCPLECIPQPTGIFCAGAAHNGLCCHEVFENRPVRVGALIVKPESWPVQAILGEVHTVRVSVFNTSATTVTTPFWYKHPDNWEMLSCSFEGVSTLTIPSSDSVTLEAQLRALAPDILDSCNQTIISFYFGEGYLDIFASIAFPQEQSVECGGFYFPHDWCRNDVCGEIGQFYALSVCCDNIFYPGSMCCNNQDCLQGTCVDGRCVAEVPSNPNANNIPLGHQSILLVLLDFDFPTSISICDDRSNDIRSLVPFEEASLFIENLVLQRTHRDFVDFRWTVITGITTKEVAQDVTLFTEVMELLDQYLASHNCPTFSQFDKVIVSSPIFDLQGWGGQAMDRGRIAVLSPMNPYLLAHELAHTFGASDLYLDAGGKFQYQKDLMGNNLGGLGEPKDAVMWGEIGLGDIDRNGVIDLAEFAAFPEGLDIENLTANLTYKDSLELSFSFVGFEGNVAKRVVLSNFRLELPEYNTGRDVSDYRRVKMVVFDSHELDLMTIAQRQKIMVRVSAELSFTDRDWKRKTLKLDKTMTVPVGKLFKASN